MVASDPDRHPIRINPPFAIKPRPGSTPLPDHRPIRIMTYEKHSIDGDVKGQFGKELAGVNPLLILAPVR